MATYATAADVATLLLVDFNAAETAKAEALIRYVSAIMRKRLRGVGADLDAGIADGSIESDLAEGVCVDVVAQAVEVKRGVKSEAHPEYTIVFQDGTAANLDLTAGQIELLTPTEQDANHVRGKAFSVHPG
ncbi:Gp19/Gp15/Gp42 family protein [Amycolatopsis circi]|uniref:Gp19/Gp15/Gp42 family protein n=1 Tax=Amycolatopsis circi TaxID=871959 RepID=UPI000E24463A|nr:Gp19/Gp15/Gp42 family protein [Amycolatopsis circi]